MERRVVITGMGAITPIGKNVEEFWNGIKEGKCGIDQITHFDTADYKVKLAAEIKDYNPEEYFDKKASKRMDKFSQYAVIAAKEAWVDSKLDKETENMEKVGVILGSGIGGLETIEGGNTALLGKGPDRVSPMFIPMSIVNMAAGNVAIELGAKGESISMVTACATGTHCIGESFRMIKHGYQDVIVAGGTEASITPTGVAGFTNIKALSQQTDKTRASIPFDKERSGFVMGEGAGVIILEELEHAKKRGAKILAEVVGYGATSDAYHITSPAEDGMGAAMAMKNAVKDAGISLEDVEYINAHGTSTHHNDLFETRAIKLAFGEHAYKMKINSTKSMIGHLLGAAGAVEVIACILQMNHKYIHATVGLQESEEELDLDYMKGQGIEKEFNYALTNSLGFGGHNASLLIKKFKE